MIIILNRKDLRSTSSNKETGEITLFDFPFVPMQEFDKANIIVFIEFDILDGGTFRYRELKHRNGTMRCRENLNSIELGHYLSDLAEEDKG